MRLVVNSAYIEWVLTAGRHVILGNWNVDVKIQGQVEQLG